MRASSVRNRILAAAALAIVLAPAGVPAHAANKDIIALQTQVQQLMDMVQRIQSTLDSKFGVLQNLADQTADEANKMTVAVTNLQKQLDAEAQNQSGKSDAISGQIQSLNDSVDELKARIAKVDKSLQTLQGQLQQMQMQAAQANAPTGAEGAAAGAPGAPAGAPGAPMGGQSGAPAGASAAPQAPPLESTYQSALRDFNAGRYTVAQSEFEDVVHYYPLDDLAGTAQFYLGEIAYQKKDYEKAISDYDAVLQNFGGNAKAPTAQLHKAYALIDTKRRTSGIRELRSLIQRYPQTPEARAARSRLNGMGVRISPR
ncbi:MAG: tetratricopeptide repeat protein [Acidobacteriota bacterium]